MEMKNGEFADITSKFSNIDKVHWLAMPPA